MYFKLAEAEDANESTEDVQDASFIPGV